MFRKSVFILIILASIDFFTLAIFPETVQKTFQFLGIGLTLFFFVIFHLYDRTPAVHRNFTFPVILLFVSVFISMFAALQFHEQKFSMTLWGERFIFFYFFYFLLSKLKIEPDYIMRVSIVLGFIYMILYIVQHTIYPTAIVSAKMFMDRGTLRIFMPGAGYLVLAYFICLYYLFRDYKIIYAIYLLLALVVFILLGTRQVIASVGLMTILFLVRSRVVKARAVIIPLLILAVIPLYFMFQPIFDSMLEVTTRQSRNPEGDVRFRALHFFLFEFFPNTTSYFTGNGMYAGNTAYARRVLSYSEVYGFFMSDLGLIGDYVKFGALFIVGAMIIIIRILTAKLPEKLMFVKYNMYIVVLTLFTGGSAFASDSNIVILSLYMYIIDYHRNPPEPVPEEAA